MSDTRADRLTNEAWASECEEAAERLEVGAKREARPDGMKSLAGCAGWAAQCTAAARVQRARADLLRRLRLRHRGEGTIEELQRQLASEATAHGGQR